jgi:hypothetical protein
LQSKDGAAWQFVEGGRELGSAGFGPARVMAISLLNVDRRQDQGKWTRTSSSNSMKPAIVGGVKGIKEFVNIK